MPDVVLLLSDILWLLTQINDMYVHRTIQDMRLECHLEFEIVSLSILTSLLYIFQL